MDAKNLTNYQLITHIVRQPSPDLARRKIFPTTLSQHPLCVCLRNRGREAVSVLGQAGSFWDVVKIFR